MKGGEDGVCEEGVEDMGEEADGGGMVPDAEGEAQASESATGCKTVP